MIFTITVRETHERDIQVEADDRDHAIAQVIEAYYMYEVGFNTDNDYIKKVTFTVKDDKND